MGNVHSVMPADCVDDRFVHQPNHGLIDAWIWRTDHPFQEALALTGLLSEQEHARAFRFHRERDQTRFILARVGMRQILARYLLQDPSRIAFNYNGFGKPRLAGGNSSHLKFNLSHSGNFAALAISTCFELGVDVEFIKPIEENIAERFFSPAECAQLNQYRDPDAWLEAFYRCWTRKEAIVKAHGAGLSLPLSSFSVSLSRNRPALRFVDDYPDCERDWTLIDLPIAEGMAGCIAVISLGNPVALRSFDCAEDFPVRGTSQPYARIDYEAPHF